MNDRSSKSILQMAHGAIQELVDYGMGPVIENIADPNTPATKARKMVLTLEFKPDAERRTIAVYSSVKTSLVPANPVVTMLYVSDGENVVEMAPQIPGQVDLRGVEQEPPAMLKIVKLA